MVPQTSEQVPDSRVGQAQQIGQIATLNGAIGQRSQGTGLNVGDDGARAVGRQPVALGGMAQVTAVGVAVNTGRPRPLAAHSRTIRSVPEPN